MTGLLGGMTYTMNQASYDLARLRTNGLIAWSPDRLDLFAAGSDGQLAHSTWDGNHWSQWETLGGFFKGGSAAVS